ncbi:MAG: right-handed parallel beta-helix repeat-containing protein, partial [Lewinella sp.]
MKHTLLFDLPQYVRGVFAAGFFLLGLTSLQAQLQGTYTIGGNDPDYATIGAAINDLASFGVSGPVVFSIRRGRYAEQLKLGKVSGASSTNTITFKSQSWNPESVEISYAAAKSSADFVLLLHGAEHYRIYNLTIRAAGTDYMRAVAVSGKVSDLLLSGNRLISPPSRMDDVAKAVLYLQPVLARDIRIRDNTISGGSVGLYFAGTETARPTGTEIIGNTVEHFGFAGVFLEYLNGGSLSANRILNAGSSGEYGLYARNWSASQAAPSLVANNFFAISTNYKAVWLIGSEYLNFYYNSISVSANGSGFTLDNSHMAVVRNNIFQTVRGYAVTITNATSLDMDYNNLLSGGTYLARWEGRKITNLAGWQNPSGRGAHSVSFDAEFASETDLHAKAIALANAGVAIPQVTTDIEGEMRDLTPSIGADEYTSRRLKPLSGIYTIGKSDEDFATFNAAVKAIERNGVAGPVTFNVAAGTYNEQVRVPAIIGASKTNTISFQSATGDAADVNLTFNATDEEENYVLSLDNASHTRLLNLTVEATGTKYSQAVTIGSRMEDVLLQGNRLVSPKSDYRGESNAVLRLGFLYGNSIRIRGNQIIGGSYGVYFSGTSYIGAGNIRPTGTEITDNVIRDFFKGGMVLHRLKGGMLTGNLIVGKNLNDASSCLEIFDWDGTEKAPVLIANNFVSLNNGDGPAVTLKRSRFIQFYHNSIYANKRYDAFHLHNTQDVSVKNNIFRAEDGLAVYILNNSTLAATSLNLDYNDLYSTGTHLAQWNKIKLPNLSGWRTISGQDVNSISENPEFVSAKNLHVRNLALSKAGIAVASVMVDIDGQDRGIPPSIGADEFGADEDGDPGGVPGTPFFSFEAECTIRDGDWRLSEDLDASGNRFVSYTGCRCESTPSVQMADQYLNYDFVTSEAATFYLFLRLDAPDVGRNSFWIRMDDGEWIKMWREEDGSALLTNGFEWRRVNDDADLVSFDLAPGAHTITVAAREPGTKLDKLVLSLEIELPVGTGPEAQTCTLYQSALAKGSVKELVLPYEEELFTEASLSVFPNPVADHLTV